MSHLAASAPGKLVLCGEYAVLDGATAICAAVDRRAVVTVADSDAGHHSVTAPGFSNVEGTFRSDKSGLAWLSGAQDYDLFGSVWRQSLPLVNTPKAFTLDTSSFRDAVTRAKIGVGSSAALAVAIATAFEALGGAEADAVAAAAHRDFQGGKGSGVDIACSLNGGVVAFRMDEPAIGRIEWPRDLHYTVYWSGIAADTPQKIERYAEIPENETRKQLGVSAEHCAAAFRGGAPSGILDALRAYCEVLRRFDEDHRLGIYGAGHAVMSDLAASAGAVYKPCGAGGGDVGIAVAASAETLALFAALADETGFARLDVRIDTDGPMLENNERS